MSTPDWLARTERVIGANHPILSNTKDRCGQAINTTFDAEHDASNGLHDARLTGLTTEVGSFTGNGSARTISLSNAGLTPLHIVAWEPASGANVCTNGEFESDTSGWTPSNCSLAVVGSGYSGNCCQITGAAGGFAWVTMTYTATVQSGRYYTLSLYHKSGTWGSPLLQATQDGNNVIVGQVPTGSWAQSVGVAPIRATSTSMIVVISCYMDNGETGFVDQVVLSEVGGQDVEYVASMPTGESKPARAYTDAFASNVIYDVAPGEFKVGTTKINTSGLTNYYFVEGVDVDSVFTGDSGAGSDPDWIESSVLNRIIADNTDTVSSGNIANNVESQIWTQFTQEHTTDGAHMVTLNQSWIVSGSYAGNNADNRDIGITVNQQIEYLTIYKDGAVVSSKSTIMLGDTTKQEATAGFQANYIQSLGNGSFQVGTALNASGATYYYVAICYET